ncbi:hypothetical protein ACE6ED_26265 [Paenibacillus sp. CN-4]|uniref:glycan biosynthesis hexose transferase WsfD n=1 Tax=Paenibacillus nanchangensis TaxID=3348343 RepID=UPI003978C805
MKKLLKPENIALLAGVIIAALLLLFGPFVGVADNGDFLRMMNTIGLNYYDAAESYEDRFFAFSHSQFAYDDLFRGFYPSSQIFLVLIPRLLGGLVHGSYFDIRMLGVVYALLLLAATWLAVKSVSRGSAAAGLLTAAVMLFVFYDIGYLAYFNSLFGEPVSLVFMLLTFALGLRLLSAGGAEGNSRSYSFGSGLGGGTSLFGREEAPVRLLVLFFVSVLFLVMSKIQNSPVGILFALMFWRLAYVYEGRRWRKLALSFAAAAFVVSVLMYVTAPKDLKHINLYQTIFYGVLYDSPDVKADLKELGLPERLEVLAGTNYFEAGTAIPQNDPSLGPDFYDRISHKDVLLFYLKHPARLIGNMEYAASNSMSIRPSYLGNYEKAEGKPRGALTSTYSGWSRFKTEGIPNTLAFLGIFYLLYYAGAVFEWFRASDRRGRAVSELLMLPGLIGIFAFMVPILGDGRADMGKHLFLFNVSFDMMVVTMAGWVVLKLARLWKGSRW